MREEDLLTESEAAKLLGKSHQWLKYRRENTKSHPPYILQDGYLVRYIKEDVLNWVNDATRFERIK